MKPDPDGPRDGPKTYILSNLNGGATPKLVEWERAALIALRKHFGYQELKGFQREALEAWAGNRDSFVLAATGSGNALRSLLTCIHDYCWLDVFLILPISLSQNDLT